MAKRKPARSSAGRSTRAARSARSGPAHLVFGRRNYVLLLGSVGLIVLGYALMAFDNARGLDARGVHLSLESALSLTVAPILLLAGYLGIFAAILWRPKQTEGAPAPAAG
ncbi:MAG TPA: DUF3098 domain-containing protein [Rubricoccaceae bacterium]|nr:DUF3098 domain-containing protein [Rubricoccaceae bacterium]